VSSMRSRAVPFMWSSRGPESLRAAPGNRDGSAIGRTLKHSKTPHIEPILVGASVLLSAVLHGVFVVHGLGEPDVTRLVVAAEEWHFTGRTLYQSYIFRTSPVFIHAIKKLLDLGVSPAALPSLLNWLAVMVGSITMIPLYLLWRKLSERGAAAIACILFIFTPAWWLANVYGMAHLPAFSLFVIALAVFAYALEKKGRTQTLMLVAATVIAMAGVGFKADMILCYGAFLGTAICLGAASRRIVVWVLVIPVLALVEVTSYARLIAPSLSGLAGFAGTWSSHFPFTIDALTDPNNRTILVNSVGRMLAAVVVLAVVVVIMDKRHRRHLMLAALWALPPMLFWGLKLGNSARHMMAAVAVLLFLVAIVITSRIRVVALRVAVVALLLTMNYVLGPAKGDTISPTSQLHALNGHVQEYVDRLHRYGKSFALLPVPSKMFVGGPGAPYALHEVMSRSKELESHENDQPGSALEIEFAEKWPRYVARYGEGVVYVVGITQVRAPYAMPKLDKWFCLSIEPGILTINNMDLWRPYIEDAVRQDPESVYGWAVAAGLRSEAGLALADIGRLEEALEMFEEALNGQPNHADAMWNAAMLYGHFGRLTEARQLLDRFIARHPADPRAETAREMRAKIEGQ
jgi:hypothetical protein